MNDEQILAETEKSLQPFVPMTAMVTGKDITLERVMPLLAAVGDPHKRLNVLHVAGTSGKTSTCYYAAALLATSGKKVGLTVSPHVDRITERLQIDGEPISPQEFRKALEEFLKLIEPAGIQPSYFELLIVLVIWYFEKSGVEYAVIETGMGGLHDATNVLQREDKVCIITDIGLDHTRILGNTLPEISAQKAGIIHSHNQVFTYEQPPEVMQPIKSRVEEKQATLHVISSSELVSSRQGDVVKRLPLFQRRNWLLAMEACQYIAQRDGWELQSIRPEEIVVPARMQVQIRPDGSIIVMDGAHNGQKMSAFVRSFLAVYPDQKAVVLLALKTGKEYGEVIRELKPIMSRCIITTFNTSQDLPAVAEDPEVIADFCRKQSIECEAVADMSEAVKKLLEIEAPLKVITGSFYLLGQIRPLL